MRKMKKVAVMCLTAAMTMSLLAGCGGAKKDTDGSTSETEVTTEYQPKKRQPKLRPKKQQQRRNSGCQTAIR